MALGPGKVPDKEVMRKAFESKTYAKELTVKELRRRLDSNVLTHVIPSPALKTRMKSFDSYYKKYFNQVKSGVNKPITDQIGIRIICPFSENLNQVLELVKSNFEVTEIEYKGRFSYNEFGYESIHLLVKIPSETVRLMGDTGCEVAEIQIRTTLQDAWAEVEHELFYKADLSPLDAPMQRKLHAAGASLSLADVIFQDIRDYQKKFYNQRAMERRGFYEIIDESIDDFIVSRMPAPSVGQPKSVFSFNLDKNSSIDELLLNALTLHNKKQFEEAMAVYDWILEQTPPPEKQICSIIHKHRGMSCFAQSKYDEAIMDFTKALELNEKQYVPAYYRGLVHAVQKRHSKAIDDFNLSLSINPYQSFCLFRRGQAYYHVGDYTQALSDCEASLAMEPKNEMVNKFRKLIQDKLQL